MFLERQSQHYFASVICQECLHQQFLPPQLCIELERERDVQRAERRLSKTFNISIIRDAHISNTNMKFKRKSVSNRISRNVQNFSFNQH